MNTPAPAEPAKPAKRIYWFPAKKYGWGWGPPTAWQGWVVLLASVLAMLAGAWLFDPSQQMTAFLVWTAAVSAVLLAICWKTGEPPRWRWGGD